LCVRGQKENGVCGIPGLEFLKYKKWLMFRLNIIFLLYFFLAVSGVSFFVFIKPSSEAEEIGAQESKKARLAGNEQKRSYSYPGSVRFGSFLKFPATVAAAAATADLRVFIDNTFYNVIIKGVELNFPEEISLIRRKAGSFQCHSADEEN